MAALIFGKFWVSFEGEILLSTSCSFQCWIPLILVFTTQSTSLVGRGTRMWGANSILLFTPKSRYCSNLGILQTKLKPLFIHTNPSCQSQFWNVAAQWCRPCGGGRAPENIQGKELHVLEKRKKKRKSLQRFKEPCCVRQTLIHIAEGKIQILLSSYYKAAVQ